jgi:hypothetical protein
MAVVAALLPRWMPDQEDPGCLPWIAAIAVFAVGCTMLGVTLLKVTV